MADRYQNFEELRRSEEAFRIEHRLVSNSAWLVAAPHGGNIESRTTEIVRSISLAADVSFYSFSGTKQPDGGDLHLTSHRFDEPLALQLAASHPRLLCVHGVLAENGYGAWLIPGGAYQEGLDLLKQKLTGLVSLRDQTPQGKRYPGLHPDNLCNRGSSGGGLQLELSSGLRKQLLSNPRLLNSFSQAIAGAMH